VHEIIDMQVGFTTPGAPAEISNAVAIIENVNKLSAACREAGVLNILVQNTIDDESKSTWSNWFEAFWTPEKRAGMFATFGSTSTGSVPSSGTPQMRTCCSLLGASTR
jgi:nicotinamidase-related amidase